MLLTVAFPDGDRTRGFRHFLLPLVAIIHDVLPDVLISSENLWTTVSPPVLAPGT